MRLLAFSCVLLAGCAASGLHANDGRSTAPGYRVWRDSGGTWHLRASPGDGLHRFQGSLEGQTGGVSDPEATSKALRDRVARLGNTVQFDFESDRREVGFDTRVTGGCLQLDLYIDGKRRPDRVRFGPKAEIPPSLPAVLCP